LTSRIDRRWQHVAALTAATVGLAAPAHADDQSLLDNLRGHGVNILPWMTSSWVSSGDRVQ
jgi:hypothetical protein